MAAAPQRLFVHRWVHDLCGARRGPELLRRRMRVDVVEEVHAPLLQLHVEPSEVQVVAHAEVLETQAPCPQVLEGAVDIICLRVLRHLPRVHDLYATLTGT